VPNRTLDVVSALVVCLSIFSGCGERGLVPPVDTQYSEFISVLSGNYERISGANATETVGVVQIFFGDGRDVSDLSQVTKEPLLFESRERGRISQMLQSIQRFDTDANGHCDLSGPSWILVAYDSALFRVGVIRLYPCSTDEGQVVGVRPVGDAAIMYSRDAVDALRAIGVLEVGSSPSPARRE